MLPWLDILDGVEPDSEAVPPVRVKLKSLACSAPEPPLLLNTGSLKVTETTELSTASSVDTITGGSLISLTSTVSAFEYVDCPSVAWMRILSDGVCS